MVTMEGSYVQKLLLNPSDRRFRSQKLFINI